MGEVDEPPLMIFFNACINEGQLKLAYHLLTFKPDLCNVIDHKTMLKILGWIKVEKREMRESYDKSGRKFDIYRIWYEYHTKFNND